MTIKLADRIKELSYTVGTGDFALNGPVTGFGSFSSSYSYNDYLFYAISDGTRYEIGSGQYFLNGATNSLRRFPLKSSNNNQIVNFPAGTKEVYVTYPATHSVYGPSGISGFQAPVSSGISFWSGSNTINYDSSLVFDSTNKRIGLRKANPQYGLDIGGNAQQGSIQASGFYVGSSGVFFPSGNNQNINYTGGRQLVHFEPNQLGDANIQSIIQLSGSVNNSIFLKKQNAGLVFAGPPSGCSPPCSPALPSFRPLILRDIEDVVVLSGTLYNVINNFNNSISGLLPTIANSGNNRLLTSTGSSVGIYAETDITYDNNFLHVKGSGSSSGRVVKFRLGSQGDGEIGEGMMTNGRMEISAASGGGLFISDSDQNFVSFQANSGSGVPKQATISAPTIIDSLNNGYGLVFGSYLPPDSPDTYTAITEGYWRARPIEVDKGGTGRTTYSNGQLLIGSGTSLSANTLTPISGISIINGSGNITIGVTGIPSSSITDFNNSVSGLLPVKDVVSGSGISIGSISGIYTISAVGVSAASASSLVTNCSNRTGSVIPKMTVVYINGGHGNLPTITPAQANNEANSSKTYGITQTQINDNSTGNVVAFGSLIDVDTNQFGASEGSVLYLSPTVAGGITATKPSAPNHMVSVGKIVRNHNNQGIIEVVIQNGFELQELHNVAISGVTDGQFLQYNSGSGLWVATNTKFIKSDTTAITGASGIINMVAISQSNYDNLAVKDPQTAYFII